ncbi:peptidoglycan-binding domain-containing protein [Actinomadura kijaniata]|uniref:peptidoglycan-binding domain-containing protein n=1 Tax=Actinomadura kijaniata TaxID=46161 RepID=UPI003F1DE27D
MNIQRVAAAGLAAAGVTLGAAAVATPASADTARYAEGTTLGPWPVLSEPQRGEEVRALQWFLNCEGQPIEVPGRYGPKTWHHIRTLQQRHQVKGGPDGNTGAYTWLVVLQRARPVNRGQSNDCVKALQVLLNKWRYNDDLPITGQHRERTQRKLQRFQQAHRLPVTGTVDTRTWHALLATPAGR